MADVLPAPPQIEKKAEDAGVSKATMPTGRMFLLAMMAGVFIGIGAAFMLLVKSDSSLTFATSSVLGGLCFSVGLFCVLTAGAELFTGNSLMVCGLLSQRYGVRDLLRNWGVVWLGNFAGSLLFVALLVLANFAGLNGGAVGETAATVAATKASLPLGTVFGRAILCNILVCVAVWMGFAATSVPGKLCCAIMPVMAFVACGFEHCVANMAFLPYGMICSGAWDWAGLCGNLIVATLGNLVGGAILVAGGYWLAYGKPAPVKAPAARPRSEGNLDVRLED